MKAICRGGILFACVLELKIHVIENSCGEITLAKKAKHSVVLITTEPNNMALEKLSRRSYLPKIRVSHTHYLSVRERNPVCLVTLSELAHV